MITAFVMMNAEREFTSPVLSIDALDSCIRFMSYDVYLDSMEILDLQKSPHRP